MILQALCDYYDRKAKSGAIAPMGFEAKPIPFIIVIDHDGNLKALKDTRERENKKLKAKSYLVPESIGRTGSAGWKTTFLLWDHYGYVLGYPKGNSEKDRKKRQQLLTTISEEVDDNTIASWRDSDIFLTNVDTPLLKDVYYHIETLPTLKGSKAATQLQKNIQNLIKAIKDAHKQNESFKNKLESLPAHIKQVPQIAAVLKFYEKKQHLLVPTIDNWMDCASISGANLSFQIEGTAKLVAECEAIVQYQQEVSAEPDSENSVRQLCMISGKPDYIERIHGTTPIPGGQATGKLVGFQKNSGFDSYGKEQAFNAPIGKNAQSAYTTALNTLTKNENSRILLGDSTIIFWADKQSKLEQTLPLFFMKPPKDDPDKGVKAVKQLFESVRTGKINTEADVRFYVLALAPNAARIAVRAWMVGTVKEFSQHIHQHFVDLEIVHSQQNPEFLPLSSLLSHTAVEYKMENVAPQLFGQVLTSVLRGVPYPTSLLHSIIRRIRAEQSVPHTKAAMIKACLNRHNRFYRKQEEELTVSLDETNTNSAYLLGRLFAVLEQVQYRALKIETIRERYYGAFSSTPVTVYPQLMKLKNHHLAKMDSGKYFFENLIGEIVDGLPGSGEIPKQLNLSDQGKFAVGYYHQRQALKHQSKDSKDATETIEEKEQ